MPRAHPIHVPVTHGILSVYWGTTELEPRVFNYVPRSLFSRFNHQHLAVMLTCGKPQILPCLMVRGLQISLRGQHNVFLERIIAWCYLVWLPAPKLYFQVRKNATTRTRFLIRPIWESCCSPDSKLLLFFCFICNAIGVQIMLGFLSRDRTKASFTCGIWLCKCWLNFPLKSV